jgi:hypothetical protein
MDMKDHSNANQKDRNKAVDETSNIATDWQQLMVSQETLLDGATKTDD